MNKWEIKDVSSCLKHLSSTTQCSHFLKILTFLMVSLGLGVMVSTTGFVFLLLHKVREHSASFLTSNVTDTQCSDVLKHFNV